jgi:hypothetical protein
LFGSVPPYHSRPPSVGSVSITTRPAAMEELEGQWQWFSLTEGEGDKFNLDPSYPSETYTLAVKFFTRRIINVEAITRTFKPLWRAEKGFSARDMGDNIILFEFEEKADLERVLLLEPWSYDKYLVAFRRLEEDRKLNP